MWRTAVSGHSEQKCSEAERLYLEGRPHHNWWVGSAKRISAAALRSPTRNYVAPSGGAVLVDGGWSPAGSAKDELGLRTGRNCGSRRSVRSGPAAGSVRAPCDDLHSEGRPDRGDARTDVAKPEHAEHLSREIRSENLSRDRAESAGAELVPKEELFRRSDVLTVHLILSKRTKGLVGADELALMKPDARLVNTSRGPIVDALIECLSKRRIGGAALDVSDVEPLPVGHPFRALDNWWRRLTSATVTRNLYRTF
jgi:hypothetical protein